MNKKLITIMFAFLIVLSLQVSAAKVSTGYGVTTSLYSQSPVQVEPGNYVEVRIKIENTGGETLENFQIELMPEFPFSLDGGEKALRTYGNVGTGIYNENGIVAKWDLRVDEDAIEGDNDLRLRYRYGTDKWIYSSNIEINVETPEAILNILSIKTIPVEPIPGEKFELNIEVENQAESALRNLKFKLNAPEQFVTLNSADEKYVKVIDSEETKNISFTLISQGDADGTIYTLPLNIVYYDNQGTEHQKEISFGLLLIEKPHIIKSVESSEVITNGRGTVSISLSNIGVDEVKFVKLNLIPSDEYKIISPPELYLGNIDSDDFENAEYDLYVQSKNGNVPLKFELEYKDPLNNKYVEEFDLELPLYTPAEAKKLGLVASTNMGSVYLGFVAFIFVALFWIYMLLDLLQKRFPRYKKIGWIVILITTTIFGALLYYFMVKRKK